ncbi:phospholipase-like protein [Tanacetum coccineum]
MCGQDKENEEDALVAILKSLVGECKAVYATKGAQIETSSDGTNKVQGMSFAADDDIQIEEGVISGALPCQLPPKELNPWSFTLPCTIGSLNLYVMADLEASVNVMPKSIFKHLKLANLKETDMVVEMADMTKKALLGIVENILVKINKFLFLSDFIIINMLGEPSETMILGRPFLATIHALIDVFNREISLGIREDRVLFDMDRGVYHSKIPVEKVYMTNSLQEEEYFNPLEIEDDVFSYESPACLLFEKCTRSCDNESIDTLDSVDNMQELKVFYDNKCGKDYRMWPTCNPDLSLYSGYDVVFGKGENGMLELLGNRFDDEESNHEDASDTGNAPKQQQQVIPQTTAISNIKLPILKKEEYDIWAMEMEHYLEYIDNDVWKERKAKYILLMAIPKEHMRRFHGMDDKKEIWEAIRTRFGGNANSKKMQKAVFKQQFEAFKISSSEGLEKGYDRFQQLLSQLEAHGAKVSNGDANHKFLRSLPPAWSNLAMTMRTKPKVDTLSIDDLYNNLRVFEQEIQGASKTSSSAQNVAFVSQSKSSTNKVKFGFTGAFSTCTPSTSSTNIFEKEVLAGFADEIAMIAIRMKKFYKKTRRRVRVDGKTPVGFNKKKLECFNCHNTGHFARECTTKQTHDGKKKRDSFYQHQEARKQEKNQIGLLTMDDGIVN